MASRKIVFRILGALYLLFSVLQTQDVKAQSISCNPWPTGYQFPVPGQPITALYGANNTSVGGEISHSGVDIGTASKPEAEVVAANDGVVKLVQDKGVSLQGTTVAIFHGWDTSGKPISTVYGHTKNPVVNVGDVVRKGQYISTAHGFQGTGVFQWHIHFMYMATSDSFRYSPSLFRNPCSLPPISTWWDGRPNEVPMPESYSKVDVPPLDTTVTVLLDPDPHHDSEETVPTLMQDNNNYGTLIFIGVVIAACLIILINRPKGGLLILTLMVCILAIISAAWVFTPAPAENNDLLSLASTAKVEPLAMVTPMPYDPVSDPPWIKPSGSIDDAAMKIITDAAALEPMCRAPYMYWTWSAESHQLDCEELLKKPGKNGCRSSAGAQGPMQFMGAFYEAGISEPGWSIGNLHDSVRAACRMWSKMNLWSVADNREAFALRFSSLDVYNAGRIPKSWGDRAWNVGQDGYNEALWIWDHVHGE